MPRLSPSLIKQARQINPLLVPLLKTCRDLGSARNELRWMEEHVAKHSSDPSSHNVTKHTVNATQKTQLLLKKLCNERGRGKPLQYLLGSEYFGDLEIQCRKGVLIPRPETADITTALANRILLNRRSLQHSGTIRVLDLCTGTGCMSLLLNHLLHADSSLSSGLLTTHTLGIDISPRAIHLARSNLARLCAAGLLSRDAAVEFRRADILDSTSTPFTTNTGWDILISNPPYISPSLFWSRQTARSVRAFEPRLALVPDMEGGDVFYPRILEIARQNGVKVVLLEVGDNAQALRVAGVATSQGIWDGVEVWNDGVGIDGFGMVQSRGESLVEWYGKPDREGRAVVCWRGQGNGWMAA